MKRNTLLSIVGIGLFAAIFLLPDAVLSAEKKTITGVVTEDYQIITESDEVYDIGDNEKAAEVMEYVGKKVKATGMVEYDEDIDSRIIHIDSFSVIEDEGNDEGNDEGEEEGDEEEAME